MQSFQVERRFEAEAASVFDVVADHAGYVRLPGVRRAYLRRAGDGHRDGLNAERVLVLGVARIVERITEFKPGRALGYQIIESPLPIREHAARLVFEPTGPTGEQTQVRWHCTLGARAPVARPAVEFLIARQLAAAYSVALALWARRLR